MVLCHMLLSRSLLPVVVEAMTTFVQQITMTPIIFYKKKIFSISECNTLNRFERCLNLELYALSYGRSIREMFNEVLAVNLGKSVNFRKTQILNSTGKQSYVMARNEWRLSIKHMRISRKAIT